VLDPLGTVDAENFDRCPADWGASDQDRTVPHEVLGPCVSPRVEQRDQLVCLRIESGSVGPLGRVAVGAGQAGVGEGGRPAVLPGPNVVDFVWEGRVDLGELTVFAPAAGPGPKLRAAGCHRSTASPSGQRGPGASVQQVQELSNPQIPFQGEPFRSGDCARPVLAQQRPNPVGVGRRELQFEEGTSNIHGKRGVACGEHPFQNVALGDRGGGGHAAILADGHGPLQRMHRPHAP